MASGRFMEEMMREHEQSLLEATCGGLFDHIDDLLDFPKEDSAADVLLLDAPAPGSPLSVRIIDVPQPPSLLALPPPPPPAPPARDDDAAFLGALEVFDAKDGHIGKCGDELDMDMAQLEWLSGLFDDASIPHEPAFPGSYCAPPIKASALGANAGVVLPDKMEDALFRSSSPTSVLEDNSFNVGAANNGGSSASSSSSSASSSSESFSGSGRAWSAPVSPRPDPPVLVIPARARSKRSRLSAFPAAVRGAAAPALETPILVPTPMYSSTSSHSDPESIAESNSQAPSMKKKKKAKKPAPPVTSDAEGDADADYEEGGGSALPPGTVRRCTHCQIEKTPQWRAGPLGPKTLCNACGVRYKSGRLFPEYRPAASPTFVPSIHSNSHKKVVEMRQKVAPKGDDLLQYIRRRD
jgi:GATA-binding protein 2